MKLRTVLISVVVTAALVGGAGYGAYYATQSQKKPVEVVPVANVSMGYFGMNEQQTIYGSITSQIAQTVTLNEDYGIEKIFVEQGDKVKEGTPLFSYDMTLPELELEMQQLELQTNELTMTRLEKELEELKKTPATASLTRDWFTLTASADETEPQTATPDDIVDETEIPGSGDDGTGTGSTGPDAQTGIEISDVEAVESESSTVENSVLSFERLVLEIQATFLACEDQLKAEDVGEAIEQAVAYYRKNLAEEKTTEEEQEDGSVKEIHSYALRESVRAALDKDAIAILKERVKTLNGYQTEYVEMLIDEAQELEGPELVGAVEKIQEAYDLLATKQQDKIENMDEFEELKALAKTVDVSEPSQEEADGDTQQPEESADGQSGEDTPSDPQSGADADASGARENTVTFDVAEGAHTTVDGEDVTNSIAMAEDGKIVFGLALDSGYELGEVLVDGSIPARKNEASEDPDDYVIEGIQTNDTIVSVQTLAVPVADNEEDPGNTGDPNNTGDPDNTGDSGNTDNPEDTGNSGDTDNPGDTESTDNSGKPENSSSEGESSYKLTINLGNGISKQESYEVGRTVYLQADLSDVTLAFTGWNVVPAPAEPSGEAEQAGQTDGAETTERTVALTDEDVSKGYAAFVMPAFDVVATARYQNAPDAIEGYVGTFFSNAEKLLAADAEQTYAAEGKDFLSELEGAIVFYQQWLASAPEQIQDEGSEEETEMEAYHLRDNVKSYLAEKGKSDQSEQLEEHYKELCLLYVRLMFDRLDPAALDKEQLEKASDAYWRLGDDWRAELEKRWEDEQAEKAEQAGQPWKTNKKGKRKKPKDFLSIGDMLAAYNVMQMFQTYLSLPPTASETERYNAIMEIWSKYSQLNDAQKALVSSDPFFAETMKQYGLWDEEEPSTEFDGGYGDDFGDMGDEPLYTAEELKVMIRDKENEIKSCELDIRQSELDLRQKQRVVDGKIVKSTMEGTVVSIGNENGESDEDYFVKVANEEGLYAKGAMNELALEKLSVGDTISGTATMSGTSFTAVIKEVSEYPETGGSSYYGYGQENTNASYYPFYALIEDTEGIEEGDAEIYLSGTAPGEDDAIYLENFFVRTEVDGRTYVYKEGDDGKLTKQYVKTGQNLGYAVEIAEGLGLEDHIAFPYGKEVKEGAKTQEVDQLQDAYM